MPSMAKEFICWCQIGQSMSGPIKCRLKLSVHATGTIKHACDTGHHNKCPKYMIAMLEMALLADTFPKDHHPVLTCSYMRCM